MISDEFKKQWYLSVVRYYERQGDRAPNQGRTSSVIKKVADSLYQLSDDNFFADANLNEIKDLLTSQITKGAMITGRAVQGLKFALSEKEERDYILVKTQEIEGKRRAGAYPLDYEAGLQPPRFSISRRPIPTNPPRPQALAIQNLTQICADPQKPNILGNWGRYAAPKAQGKHTPPPVVLSSVQQKIVHSFSLRTHGKLQEFNQPMDFNDVKAFIEKIITEHPMCEFGIELANLFNDSQDATIQQMARAALAVCVDCGVYTPIPSTQTRQGQSVRGPK
ncbi:MAG: hypothetical protein R3D88_07260 [Alphaproteobacteria bacterium]|nr:hypothetical protein [Alphaproteobacteria bacterium]